MLLPFLLISQDIYSDFTDSDWVNQSLESELFDVNELKLDRLLWSNNELLEDSLFSQQIVEIKSRASNFTKDEKYGEANILLESAIDLIISIRE